MAEPGAPRSVPIETIRPSPFQPRRYFAESELDGLAQSIREISAKLNHEVALLLDTQGPAIRTGVVEKTYDLKAGDWVSFTVKGQKGTVQITVDVNYPYLVDDIDVGKIVMASAVRLMEVRHF